MPGPLCDQIWILYNTQKISSKRLKNSNIFSHIMFDFSNGTRIKPVVNNDFLVSLESAFSPALPANKAMPLPTSVKLRKAK
jgi:hypothetical protein